MIKRIASRISIIFYKLYRVFDRYSKKVKGFTPYKLNYTTTRGTPRILHVNGNFVIGGTSQLIADLVERTSDNYSHHVIVPAQPDPLPYQPIPITDFPVNQLDRLYDWLKKEPPALVHIHYWIRPQHRFYDFGVWYESIFRICEELELKVIQNINVPTRPFASSSVMHNVFVSEYVKREFNDQPTIPSSVIYPGSDLKFFSNPSNESMPENVVGMVYRLDPDKLDPAAIEPFILAARQKPALLCYIIGGGHYLDLFKKRVKEEKLTRQFIFTGYVSYKELPAWYKKLGLVVAPVHDESFGQVTPFAMGMGLPVTGYDIGALSEILGSNETLVKPGDSQALANTIISLINNREKRTALGNHNKEKVQQQFSVEGMISEYEKLYAIHAERK